MAKFEIDSLKQNESFVDLDFTQNEYELYQKFFKTNFKRRKLLKYK